jgi:predicted transporter
MKYLAGFYFSVAALIFPAVDKVFSINPNACKNSIVAT